MVRSLAARAIQDRLARKIAMGLEPLVTRALLGQAVILALRVIMEVETPTQAPVGQMVILALRVITEVETPTQVPVDQAVIPARRVAVNQGIPTLQVLQGQKTVTSRQAIQAPALQRKAEKALLVDTRVEMNQEPQGMKRQKVLDHQAHLA